MVNKIFVLSILSILLLSVVSAFDWDNVKSYSKPIGDRYGEITFKNAFGLPLIGSDLAKVKLTSNSDICIDCYAEGTTTLYTDGYLMNDLKFRRSTTDTNYFYRQYKIYIQNGFKEQKYTEEVCDAKKLITDKWNCYNVEKTMLVPNWIEYNWELLKPGIYNWRIESKKAYYETIDWVGTWFGIDGTEWAVWGGTNYTDGNYSVHVFRDVGTFSFNHTNAVPLNVSVLVVAGGGGGSCGGGGAGGLIYNLSYYVGVGENIAVSVGAGGVGTTIAQTGRNGTNSSFGLLKALGGGGGSLNGESPASGGSGGGGGCSGSTAHNGGAPYPNQGTYGGRTVSTANPYPSGGGGGAGQMGGNATGSAGNGGNGLQYSINGTAVYYAGGGGGGTFLAGTPGTGGLGGGGAGASASAQGGAGVNGTGGGGGGGGNGGAGGNYGGSGIVIVRFLTADAGGGGDTTLSGKVDLLTPLNAVNITSAPVKFSANASATNGNVSNMTLTIWNATTVTNFVSTSGTFNVTNWSQSGLANAFYTWNVYACYSNSTASLCNYNSTNRTFQLATPGAGIFYGSGTTPNGAVLAGSSFVVNVSATSAVDYSNATIRLYDGSSNLINSTFHTTQPVYLTYTGLTDGTYYINVTGYSTNGNTEQLETYTWKLDNVAPTVSFVYPLNAQIYNVSWPGQLNYSASDPNLGACWYKTRESGPNVTISCGTNVTDLFTDGSELNTYFETTKKTTKYWIWANDSAGNEVGATINFTVSNRAVVVYNYSAFDTTVLPPNNSFLNYNSTIVTKLIAADCGATFPLCNTAPVSGPFYTSLRINSNQYDSYCSYLSNDLEDEWLSCNNSLNSVFSMNSQRNLIFFNNYNLSDGEYYWNMSVKSYVGTWNISSQFKFTVDTVMPSVQLFSPSGAMNQLNNGQNMSLNYSVSDTNLAYCWFNYNSLNVTVPCNNNHSFLYVSGKNSLTLYANDSAGNVNSANTSWGVTLTLVNNTYSPTTYETAYENFESNVELFPGLTLLSSSLVYNGTQYSGASLTLSGPNTYAFRRSIDIPLNSNPFAVETKNFYWMIEFTNGNILNTSSLTQNVSSINIVLCNSTFNNLALNFTTYDTVAPTIPLNASFEATFSIRSPNGTTALSRNFSYSSINESRSNWMFCLNASGTNVTVNSFIDYYAPGYDPRDYIIQDGVIGSFTQNIPLYLTSTSTTDIVTITVKDQNYNPLAGSLVTIQQWNIGSNSFSTIGMFTTGNQGTGLMNLVLYTTWYRAMVTIGGELVEVTDIQKMDDTSWEILVDLGTTNPYDLFGTINHGLTFNNATNITTFTWSDSSGYTQKGCLIVKNMTALGYSTISSECTVTTAGTISYLLPPGGDYYMQGVLFLDDSYGVSQVVDELFERLGVPAFLAVISPFGKVISFLLIGTGGLIGAAASSPVWGIGLIIIAMFISWQLGWLNLTTGIFTSFFVALLVAWFRQFRRNG